MTAVFSAPLPSLAATTAPSGGLPDAALWLLALGPAVVATDGEIVLAGRVLITGNIFRVTIIVLCSIFLLV